MLIIQGDLDSAGPAASSRAARRAGARAQEGRRAGRGRAPARGQSPAGAGDRPVRSQEYGQLESKTISPEVATHDCRLAQEAAVAASRTVSCAESIRLQPDESRRSEGNVARRDAGRPDPCRRRDADKGRPRGRRRSRRRRCRRIPRRGLRGAGRDRASRGDESSTADILLQVRAVPADATACVRGQVVIGFADPLGAPRGDPRRSRRRARRCCRWS